MSLPRRALRAATVLLLPLLALGLWLGWLQATGNLAEVVPGAVYRSNQPDAEELSDYVRRLGIRTVVNLRGAAPGESWYEIEKATARDLGITLIDFPLSSARDLTETQMDDLVALLKTTKTPVLIHCRSGSNRTGLAAAAYLAFVAGADPGVAERQISLRFGHVWLPFGLETEAMDRSFAEMLERFGPRGSDPVEGSGSAP